VGHWVGPLEHKSKQQKMFIDNNFKFEVSLSCDAYYNKEIVSACIGSAREESNKNKKKQYGISRKMSFKQQSVTPQELLDYCMKGHSFCNIFSGFQDKGFSDKGYVKTYRLKDGSFSLSAKAKKYFHSANVICADVEGTSYTNAQDYINQLSLVPTFWHTTFSNQQPGKGCRFRLVYVLDEEITGADNFYYYVNIFNTRIEKEVGEYSLDYCNLNPNQYYNGTCVSNPNLVVDGGISNCIYSLSDICGEINESNIERERQQHTIVEWENADKIEMSKYLINAMEQNSYDDFMKYNRHKYSYIYRKETEEWIDELYQYVEDDYFSLFFYAGKKVQDGEKRRKKLFMRMCLRRVIDPEIDADTLLFCAYEDRERFFDNSDGVISIDCLVRNVGNAMKLTIEEIEEKYSETLEYYRGQNKSGVIFKKGNYNLSERNIILKSERYNRIDVWYNVSLSVMENLKIAEEKNIKVSKNTLYRYCENRGINTSPLKQNYNLPLILSLYDETLSLRKNVENMKNNGIKIGKDKLDSIIKKNKERQQHTIVEWENADNFDVDIDEPDLTELNELHEKIVQAHKKAEYYPASHFKSNPDTNTLLDSAIQRILAEYNSQIMYQDNHEEDCIILEDRNFMDSYRSLFFER